MGRTFSAVVTFGEDCLGTAGPFAVEVPWWSEVEPVVAILGRTLGVPVMVLRLISVEGGDGARDGHVTYHVEALQRPPAGLPNHVGPVPNGSHELRAPWAEMDGLRELLGWASDVLAGMGRPLTGPVEQRRTWNLAALFRLPTDRGTVWLKATPRFAADEAAVMAAFARVDPGLVPVVMASGPGRMLLEHLPGEDCWDAPADVITSAVSRLAAAQAALTGAVISLPDRRDKVLAAQIRSLLAGPVADDLSPQELDAAHRLTERWPALEACGLPDTIVHGDFHPGNWRSDGGPPVALDWADAYIGNPVLDGLRAYDYLPKAKQHLAAKAWAEAWKAQAPGSDPARALAVAEPLAHLAYALRYQEFLDGIEPDERIYHLGDPASCVREALRVADAPGWTPA